MAASSRAIRPIAHAMICGLISLLSPYQNNLYSAAPASEDSCGHGSQLHDRLFQPFLRPGVGLYPDFSPDSTFIAHTTSTGAVGLVDVGSGRELAQLAHPHLDSAHLAFTPDGTRLIMLTNGTVRGIHIWDLRSIRKELARMGLD